MVAKPDFLANLGDPIVPALFAAAGVHLVLAGILGFGVDWTPAERNTVAVTVALTPATLTPDKATHVAAENQLGDTTPGMEAPQVRMQTSLTLSRELDMGDGESGTTPTDTLSQELAALEQAVSSLSDSNHPRNPRLGSVAARKALDADYLARWRARVEQVGNVLYRGEPPAGNGDVRLLVSIMADGMLEKIRIISSSGNESLDRAAIDTVTLAAPFPPFSNALAKQTSRLEIVRTWQFRTQAATPE